MQLKHSFSVPASKDETWAAFNDIESVAVCFPGAQVTSVEGDTFEGTVKVKLGPIALVYKGTGTFTDKDESAGRMVIAAKGKDKRGNGTAGADVVATMTGNGDSTDIEVVTDLNVTGKPAQFGRGVMQDVSDKLLGQFVDCLQNKVGGSGAASDEEAASADAAPAAGGAAASAAGAASPTGSSSDPAGSSAVADPGPTPDPSAPTGSAASTSSAASASSGPAPAASAPPPPTPAPAPAARPAPAKPASGSSTGKENDALDLGATVIPILLKAYWKPIAALIIVIIVIVLLIKSLG